MSYEDTAKLYTDSMFQGRLQAATTSESRAKLPSALAVSILAEPLSGMWAFMPWVTSEPGFDVEQSQITDGMLLSAIQSVWDDVETQGL